MSAFVSFERLLNSFFRQDIAETEMYDSFGHILMHQGLEVINAFSFERKLFSKCSQTYSWDAQKKLELKKLINLLISEGKESQHELRGFFERTGQKKRRFSDFNLPNKTIFEQLKALNILIKKEEKGKNGLYLYTPIDIGLNGKRTLRYHVTSLPF